MQRKKIGLVIRIQTEKTIVIKTIQSVKHKKYSKVLQKSLHLLVHDEFELAKIGNFVEVIQTQPISKSKFWKLKNILSI